MHTMRNDERLDTLLALALASNAGPARSASGPRPEGEGEAGAAGEFGEALELLSGLPAHDRRALRSRVESLSRLPPEQLSRWLTQRLSAARPDAGLAPPDEQIHPSHVAEALDGESRPVRLLILGGLPPTLARQSAELLGLSYPPTRQAAPAPRAGPAAEVVRVIRRAFLSRFVRAEELPAPAALDGLSAVELRRLVKLLGAREIGYACRSIPVEDVALFLRRFPAEDTQMIAPFVSPHTRVEPRRADFAERLVESAVAAEVAPEAMLHHVGLRLLATALSEGGATRLRYSAQKIPYEAASVLHDLVAGVREAGDPELTATVAAEAEALAAGLRRPQSDGYSSGRKR